MFDGGYNLIIALLNDSDFSIRLMSIDKVFHSLTVWGMYAL